MAWQYPGEGEDVLVDEDFLVLIVLENDLAVAQFLLCRYSIREVNRITVDVEKFH